MKTEILFTRSQRAGRFGKGETEFAEVRRRFRCHVMRVAVAGLTAACLGLAGSELRADEESGFERFAGTYKGKAMLAQPSSEPGTGRATAVIRPAKKGDGGELNLRANVTLGANSATVKRELDFGRRNFKSKSLLAASTTSAPGRGQGRSSFRGRLLRYKDNSIFQSSGTSVPVFIQGTARFRPNFVRIQEIWDISGTPATFSYNLKRKK